MTLVTLLWAPFFCFAQCEQKVTGWIEQVRHAGPEKKIAVSDSIRDCLIKNSGVLQHEAFHKHPYLKMIKSEDGRLTIFSWAIPDDFFVDYFVLILYGKKNKINTFYFIDTTSSNSLTYSDNVSQKRWPGAVYYDLLPAGKNQWVLIGWNAGNMFYNVKLIETLSIRKNKVEFGIPLLMENGKMISRKVFKFAEESIFTLKIDHKQKHIIFDHLIALQNSQSHPEAFMVPDGSYDAFVYDKKKKRYIYTPKYDALNPKDSKDKLYKDPRK